LARLGSLPTASMRAWWPRWPRAGRFAERRKRRQRPWLAKLEPVRPGPVAPHPGLTRYPGPKPPPFARRGAGGHGRRQGREFLSRSVCQLVTPVGRPPRSASGLTQRPGKRQSRPLHPKPCGSPAGAEHTF